MANLKEIRVRIGSVQSTQKITGAMKMVSASKLRRAQNAILGLRPYSNKLNELLQQVSQNQDNNEDINLFEQRPIEKVILIVITSNKGLCGSFNSNIIKEAQRHIEEKYATQASKNNVKLICLGRKGKEQLSKKFEVIQCYESLVDAPKFTDTTKIAQYLIEEYEAKNVDKIEIIYNRFINPATQTIEIENFLPVTNKTSTTQETTLSNYLFEPSMQIILKELMPKILKVQFHKTVIDSVASEHGARMTAMHKATDNANEILKDLKLKYNNARQAAITKELIEIVGGAEALNE